LSIADTIKICSRRLFHFPLNKRGRQAPNLWIILFSIGYPKLLVVSDVLHYAQTGQKRDQTASAVADKGQRYAYYGRKTKIHADMNENLRNEYNYEPNSEKPRKITLA